MKTPDRITQKIPKISLSAKLVYIKPTTINKAIKTTLNNWSRFTSFTFQNNRITHK